MSASGATSILVYDPNWLNPYGVELSSVLASDGHDVQLFSANVRTRSDDALIRRRRLAANRPKSSIALGRWLAGRIFEPMRVAAATMRRRRNVLIVIWLAGWWDDFVFSCCARLRRVYYLEHNPAWARPTGNRGTTRRTAARATAVLVHSASLRKLAGIEVVTHPSYIRTVEQARLSHSEQNRLAAAAPLATLGEARHTVCFVGDLRPDKGVDSLVALVAQLDQSYQLTLAGATHVPDRLVQAARLSGVTVITSGVLGRRLTDSELLTLLLGSDLVIAPYSQPTQSGSLIFALTARRSALAFDAGALHELLVRDSLVPPGDVDEFARRIRKFFGRPWECWLLTAEELDKRCAQDWADILASAPR